MEIEEEPGGKEAYLKWQEMGQTEHTQRETYKLASAEDSDVPSQNERPRQLALNLPSRLSRLPSQAELVRGVGWKALFLLFCYNILPFSF